MIINKEFSDYKAECTYSVSIGGYYDYLDVEVLDGSVFLDSQYVLLLLTTSSPVLAEINGEKMYINFTAKVSYKLKARMRNYNYELIFSLHGLDKCGFSSIKLVDGEVNDSNIDEIKKFLIDELKKTKDIDVKVSMKNGPFDKIK